MKLQDANDELFKQASKRLDELAKLPAHNSNKNLIQQLHLPCLQALLHSLQKLLKWLIAYLLCGYIWQNAPVAVRVYCEAMHQV